MLICFPFREAGARFLNLDISSLTDKWYGESQKLAGAVFTLAAKLQPCIIFIDEIDSLLRVRDQHDHEATAMIKAQFMQLWDGLTTDPACTVLVMGATNRPRDVDKAILRYTGGWAGRMFIVSVFVFLFSAFGKTKIFIN